MPYLRQVKLKRRKRGRRIRFLALSLLLAVIPGLFYFGFFSGKSDKVRKRKQPTKIAVKQEKKSRPKKSPPPKTLRVAAVGDIHFARAVTSLVTSGGANEPLRLVASHLQDADLTIANLECPLSSRGTRLAGKDVTFRGVPAGAIGLKNAGVDVVTLANNHLLDYGTDALQDTLTNLDSHGIYRSGAGGNLEQATTPATIALKKNKTKVSFLGFSYIIPSGFYPTETKAGIAPARPAGGPARPDPQIVIDRIKEGKKRSDFVICYFHWGAEYQDWPLKNQRDLAHLSIDAGADLVLGSHPHVIQGLEFYKGKLIAYSLGDFVFDHYSQKTGEAFILKCALSTNGQTIDISATPIYLSSSGQPRVVAGSNHGNQILARLARISRPYGTNLANNQGIGVVTPQIPNVSP